MKDKYFKEATFDELELQFMNEIFEILDYCVYPSNESTIIVAKDEYGGAHKYFAKKCLGVINDKVQYIEDEEIKIQFVHKHEDGTITPGLQDEQLAYIMLDRINKLNAKFPCEENSYLHDALEEFINTCKVRKENRLNRGVLGELKK